MHLVDTSSIPLLRVRSPVFPRPPCLNREHDFALLSELDGVGEQVDQNLPQAGYITIHSGRNLVIQQVSKV